MNATTTTTYTVTFQPADHDIDPPCLLPADVCDYRAERKFTTEDEAHAEVTAAKGRGDRDIWMKTTTTRKVKQ